MPAWPAGSVELALGVAAAVAFLDAVTEVVELELEPEPAEVAEVAEVAAEVPAEDASDAEDDAASDAELSAGFSFAQSSLPAWTWVRQPLPTHNNLRAVLDIALAVGDLEVDGGASLGLDRPRVLLRLVLVHDGRAGRRRLAGRDSGTAVSGETTTSQPVRGRPARPLDHNRLWG